MQHIIFLDPPFFLYRGLAPSPVRPVLVKRISEVAQSIFIFLGMRAFLLGVGIATIFRLLRCILTF